MNKRLCKCHPASSEAYRADCERANERAEQADKFDRMRRQQEYINARREPGDE